VKKDLLAKIKEEEERMTKCMWELPQLKELTAV
jgi:hypothetical protein